MNDRPLYRHLVATLAYRSNKALNGASSTFATFDPGHGVRRPLEILRHMRDLMNFSVSRFENQVRLQYEDAPWDVELERYLQLLERLDALFQSGTLPADFPAEWLLQGPLADALTHVGQLMMLRRQSGDPVPYENFIQANIHAGNIRPERSN